MENNNKWMKNGDGLFIGDWDRYEVMKNKYWW